MLVALVSVVVTAYVGLDRGDSLAEEEIKDQLSAVGAARADQVERYVGSLERAIIGQALTPRPALAIDEFMEVYRDLNAEPPSVRNSESVETYYREVVAPELSEARDRPVNAASLLPIADAAITLQAQFVVPDPDTGEPLGRLPDWTELDESTRCRPERIRASLRVRRRLSHRPGGVRRRVLDGEEHRLRNQSSQRSAERDATRCADRQPGGGPDAG